MIIDEFLQERKNSYNYVAKVAQLSNYSITWDQFLEEFDAHIAQGLLEESFSGEYRNINNLICLSCAFNDLDFSKWLIANGASTAVSYFNSKITLLHVVAKNGNKELAKLLMKNGADIDCTDFQGNTPLHLAAENGHLECVEYLMRNYQSIVSQNHRREFPLHLAVENGHLECAMEIITEAMNKMIVSDLTIDFSHQNIEGNTALHLAVKDLHCTKYLLKERMFRSSINKRNKEGNTALHLAILHDTDTWFKKREIIMLFLEKSDDFTINSAYDCAKNYNDIRILKVFQNYFLKQKRDMKKNSIKLEKQESWSKDFILYASNISSIVASVLVLINEIPLCIKEVSFIHIITVISKILSLLTIPAMIYAIKKHNELDLFYQTIEEHKTKIEETADLTKVKREESNDLETEVPYNHDQSGSNDGSSRKTSNQLALPLNTLEVHTTQQQEQNSYMFSKSELHPNELKRTSSFHQSSPASNIFKAKPRAFSIPPSSTKLQSIPNEFESLAITQHQTTNLVEQHGNLNAISKRYCKSSVGSFKFSRPKQHAEQSQPLLSRSTPSVLMQAMSTNKELSHYDNISP